MQNKYWLLCYLWKFLYEPQEQVSMDHKGQEVSMELLLPRKLLLSLDCHTSGSFRSTLPCYSLESLGPERERDLHKVTQQVSDRPRTGACISSSKSFRVEQQAFTELLLLAKLCSQLCEALKIISSQLWEVFKKK